MKMISRIFYIPFFLVFLISKGYSQENLKKMSIHEVHFSNGMGWAFPVGPIQDVLKPKFSGNTSLYIALKDKPWYLNPSLDLLIYGYDQIEKDPDFEPIVENGRALSYVLNLTGGYRKKMDKISVSGFIGPGISLFAEPRATYSTGDAQVKLSKTYHLTPTFKAGIHTDYKIRNVYLYIETSWQTHFVKVQNRNLNQFILLGGIKTNISRVTDEVISILEKPISK